MLRLSVLSRTIQATPSKHWAEGECIVIFALPQTLHYIPLAAYYKCKELSFVTYVKRLSLSTRNPLEAVNLYETILCLQCGGGKTSIFIGSDDFTILKQKSVFFSTLKYYFFYLREQLQNQQAIASQSVLVSIVQLSGILALFKLGSRPEG